MSEFSNNLTDAELERLALLAEELCEAGQIIQKIIRHGYESYHPKNPEITNRELLMKELAHVDVAVNLMCMNKDIYQYALLEYGKAKLEDIHQWLHHQDKGEQP